MQRSAACSYSNSWLVILHTRRVQDVHLTTSRACYCLASLCFSWPLNCVPNNIHCFNQHAARSCSDTNGWRQVLYMYRLLQFPFLLTIMLIVLLQAKYRCTIWQEFWYEDTSSAHWRYGSANIGFGISWTHSSLLCWQYSWCCFCKDMMSSLQPDHLHG